MEGSEIEARIVSLLVGQHGCAPGSVGPESRLEEDLGLDSLAMLDLFLSLEEAFSVSIPDEVAARVTSVGEAADAVAGLIG